jgi:O-antigen/teichoic acid export membrane protein
MRQLLKDSAIYGVAGTASRFVSILLVPIYTRLFSPGEYGLLDLLVTTSLILILLSGMQIDSGVARSYYEAKRVGQDRKLVGTVLILYSSSVAAWTVLFALSFHVWFYGYVGITWAHVVPLLAALLPTQFLGLWLLLLRFERRPHFFAFLSAGDILTSALLSIVAVVGLGWGIPGVLWSLFVSKLVWALIGMKLLAGRFRIAWHGSYAKEILAYGVPIVPAVLSKWTQNYANRFVMVATLPMFQVGLFSLAVKTASVVALVDTAFRLAWDPYAMETIRKPGSEERYARMLDFYLVGMFGICAAASALGWFAVKILATDAYLPAGRLVGFIAMGLLWNGSLQILGLGINIVRKTYWAVVGCAIGAIVNVVTLWATAKQWGLVTAGVTYLLAAITIAMIILSVSQRHHHIPFRYLVIVLILVSSLLLPSFYYLMPEPAASMSAIAANALTKLVAAGILWIAVATLVIRREDRERLLGAVRLVGRGKIAG